MDTMIDRESTPLLSEGSVGSTITLKNEQNDSNVPFMRYSMRKMLGSVSITERQRALKLTGVGPAASLIKDAVLGYQDAPYEGTYDPYANPDAFLRNTLSIVCGRFVAYNWAKNLLLGANWVLFFLTFFEPPHWCRDSGLDIVQPNLNASGNDYGDCEIILNARGTTADGEENQAYYPNWSVMWLSISESKHIELICIFMISFYMILKLGDDGFDLYLFFYPGYKRRANSSQIMTLVCLLLGIVTGITTLNPFFRMIILGSFLRNFQTEFWTMMKMIPEMAYILAILAFIIFFFAWFGVVLFYDSEQGTNGFSNLLEGVWTLWICVTTANYPDVMMPSYNDNRLLSAVYFISFMIISFFYLINLILAVTVNSYDDSIVERRCRRKALSRNLLEQAYKMLDHDNQNSVSREAIMAVILILNQDVPEIQRLSKEERGIIFAFLDKDGSSTISPNEFLDFGQILLLQLTKESDYATLVQRKFPNVYQSYWFQNLCKFVRSTGFEYFIDVVLVLNAVTIAFQDYPILVGKEITVNDLYNDGFIDTLWERTETIFTLMYIVEAILKITVDGWKRYSESMRNRFDFVVTFLAVLATVYVYYPNMYSNSQLIRFVVMARVLRLGRLLLAFKSFQTFGTISIHIIPAASSVLMILLFVLYSFSSMGMFLYGGMITRDPANPSSYKLLQADDFVDNNYWANNFNDMFSGMNVLINLLVVNNWTECEIGFEFVTGAKRVRFFFFAFHLLGVILINNVVTSFIINAYFQQNQTVKQRQGWEEVVHGEALIKGERGVFDATTVTGTKTGARSMYIAQINPRYMDIEVDERAALRNLFTRANSEGTED